MNIRQLSVSYVPEQDRLLLKVNTAASEEIRLWLTRRLMTGLWPLLNQLSGQQILQLEAANASLAPADDGLKKMLIDFRKEQLLRETDFDTPFEDAAAALPLGPEPLLVTDIDASPLSGGGIALHFHERQKDREQRGFRMQMEPRLIQGLMHLVGKALARSQWSDAFPSALAADDASLAGAHRLGTDRPKYLN